MSTVAKLLTASEFLDWVSQPENRGCFFELERGEVIELPPPGKLHGFVCGNITRILGNHTQQAGRGYVCSNDSGILVEQDPDTVRGPDVTLYLDADTAEDMTRGYAQSPPVLAVEVLSPHDRIGPTMRRVEQLLSRGVKMVWLVDAETREVSICRNGKSIELLKENAKLADEDFLPGLNIVVNDFFALPARK